MARIQTYQVDTEISGSDKWIGTDSQNNNVTRNFTPAKLAEYFNTHQVINTGANLRYKYVVLQQGDERPFGSISFEQQPMGVVNYSSITSLLVCKASLNSSFHPEFLSFMQDGKVLLYDANNINSFGFYKVTSVVEHQTEGDFFVFDFEFLDGNGYITENFDYIFSLIVDKFTSASIQESIELTVNGETGESTFDGVTLNIPDYSQTDIVDVQLTKGETYQIDLIQENGDVIPIEFTQSYRHNQSTNSNEWIIIHNLGYKPSVTVIDLDGDVINGDITYDSDNKVTLTFAQPIKGEAYLS